MTHSHEVFMRYKSDQLIDYTYYYDWLVKNGHPLIVMAGEFDTKDGAGMLTKWLT